MDTAKPSDDQYAALNYCVSFIDLLGQRAALRGQGLVPKIDSPEEKAAFLQVLKESVGTIANLQKRATDMLAEATGADPEPPRRGPLSPEQKLIWGEMNRTDIRTQRWSDGLVSFVNLGDKSILCPLNGVFHLFGLAGALCFLGLSSNRPLRGAIETAWGMELHPGELYGAVIARAYELESEIAQYPRIVVGSGTIQLLIAHQQNPLEDVYSQHNRGLADLCLKMLARDLDGYWIVNYLGRTFRESITQAEHDEMYEAADRNVVAQHEMHQKAGNSKLAFRYANLRHYFAAHRANAV